MKVEQLFNKIRNNPEFDPIWKYFQFTNLEGYATDFGHITSKEPLAVFFPPTIQILQEFIKLANQYKLKITCRGNAGTVYGQAQCDHGIIIDLSGLNILLEYSTTNCDAIKVPSFKTWLDVTNYVKIKNKTIAVTIDDLDLTVGGTLCFGAIGGTSYLSGSAADNVQSMDVLTLDGILHHCSPVENQDLFHAILCGLGQFGIIINVTLPLIQAKKFVKIHSLIYKNVSQFLKDQKTLYEAKLLDHLKGSVRKKQEQWEYVIDAVSYFDDVEHPQIEALLKKASPDLREIEVKDYYEFINLVTNYVAFLAENGKLNFPHPWYNVFVPEAEIEAHLAKILEVPYLTGTEPIIVYPLNKNKFKCPFFIKPQEEIFYQLGVLYNTSMEATENFSYQNVMEENKKFYLEIKNVGGCRYPIDAISFTKKDWKDHFGEQWNDFCRLKQKYDPYNILATGFQIFSGE